MGDCDCRHGAHGEEVNPTVNVGGIEVKRCFINFGKDDYGNWLRGTISDQPVSFAASNNSDNLISAELVERLKLPTVKCTPFVLQTSDGTIVHGGDRLVRDLDIELDDDYRSSMDFGVAANLPCHDVLLGWPFFINAGLVEFFGDKKMRIADHVLQIHTGRP